MSLPTGDITRGRRLEMILRQVESLPTLPAVATKLLSLTASGETHAGEIAKVLASDPALTSRVLATCRSADMGVRGEVMTVDRAVILLGNNAIRNIALSVKVAEVFDNLEPPRGDDDHPSAARFDRTGFWRHSLAVAIAAELIATAHKEHSDLPPGDAFVCGLLHDIGKLAVDHILPKSYARVVELTEFNNGNIAEIERRVIGLDHHTVGKRLAEQWRLPHRLQDCIWLHGSSYDSLPRLEHRRLVGLISLADALVRQHHIGYSGNHVSKPDIADLAAVMELDVEKINGIVPQLFSQLESRAQLMGLDDTPSQQLLLNSIQQANETLGRLNVHLEKRSIEAKSQQQMIEAITAFHDAAAPGRRMQDVLNEVARSAWHALGPGFYAMLCPIESPHGETEWLICQYGEQSQPRHSEVVDPPPHAPDLRTFDPREPLSMAMTSVLPWITDYLLDAPDLRDVRLLPLGCGWGTAAFLLHDQKNTPPWAQMAALTATWGTTIASITQHDGARKLGEDLAEANLALAEAQDRLLHTESMARLGEMAAGAAHEMNNPLAVISGRSQLLAMNLPRDTAEHKAAQTIVEQADQLSNLITSLKLFADPPEPKRYPANIAELFNDALSRLGDTVDGIELSQEIPDDLPAVRIDVEHVGRALDELLNNAAQAGARAIHLAARLNADGSQLLLDVHDDGCGMDARTLAHAKDPFFSAKSAGRRVGIGLTRAQQLAAAHGGGIELRSRAGEGTVATIVIALEGGGAPADTTPSQALTSDAGERIAAS